MLDYLQSPERTHIILSRLRDWVQALDTLTFPLAEPPAIAEPNCPHGTNFPSDFPGMCPPLPLEDFLLNLEPQTYINPGHRNVHSFLRLCTSYPDVVQWIAKFEQETQYTLIIAQPDSSPLRAEFSYLRPQPLNTPSPILDLPSGQISAPPLTTTACLWTSLDKADIKFDIGTLTTNNLSNNRGGHVSHFDGSQFSHKVMAPKKSAIYKWCLEQTARPAFKQSPHLLLLIATTLFNPQHEIPLDEVALEIAHERHLATALLGTVQSIIRSVDLRVGTPTQTSELTHTHTLAQELAYHKKLYIRFPLDQGSCYLKLQVNANDELQFAISPPTTNGENAELFQLSIEGATLLGQVLLSRANNLSC